MMYEISKIKIVIFRNPYCYSLTEGAYGEGCYVNQFMYVEKGSIKDIFVDKYIEGLYDGNKMPNFIYNSSNSIHSSYLNEEERKSGLISYERLLYIYCLYNKAFLSYEEVLLQEEVKGNSNILVLKRNGLKTIRPNNVYDLRSDEE